MEYVWIKYCHLLSILILTAMIVTQWFLVRPTISRRRLEIIAAIDATYGLAALGVLMSGVGLWFWVGKPPEYYTDNPLFHLKVTLFVVMALVSLYPTVQYLKCRRSLRFQYDDPGEITLSARLRSYISVQIALILIIPLLAVLVARGFSSWP
ncbi:DUF2214 family protein [Vibrio sp. SM6]|uniref:DUF2214 family protein n=1 Tax=Vibrio agarilyticus TaxID=2726741 RepID=A0A7X8YH08_9VIBR|nr:DUF2214 family protein [Vibrio agarilyticus]NLS12956.1 DUF2214 family protein [Vibrio agarilyticus]